MGPGEPTDEVHRRPVLRTRVRRSFTFEASHQLPWHPGKCANLHGHSYRLEVDVSGPLDDNGIVVDFGDIKAAVTGLVLRYYDHAHLNELMPNPTVELVAADIATRLLKSELPITAVTVHETATCSATVDVHRG